MRRWAALAGWLIATTLVTGCGSLVSRDHFRENKDHTITNVARVTTPMGRLSLYQFTTRKGQCGEGYDLAGSGGGSWAGPCGSEDLLSEFGGGAEDYQLFMGTIHDPRIARVMVTLSDGRRLQAQVTENFWYLLLPVDPKNPQRPGDQVQVEGFDSEGNQLYPKVQ